MEDVGGDYGFAWTPHGTYARDLEHFVKLLDFTPMEALVAATAGVAKIFMREEELGKIAEGYVFGHSAPHILAPPQYG
jgi:imidazolonepropionase-like amidohydrolase